MAWDYLKDLIDEVGPRGAGTEGESKAREWILQKCHDLGLKTEVYNFNFIKADYYGTLRISTLLIVLFALMWFSRDLHPTLTIIAALLFLFFEFRVLNKIELHLAKSTSANILASLDKKPSEIIMSKEKPIVMIAAHYDTAKTTSKSLKALGKYLRFLLPITLLAFILFLGVDVTRAIAYTLVWGSRVSAESVAWLDLLWRNFLWPFFMIVTSPFIILYVTSNTYSISTRKSRPDSQGADDNASGIAAALEIMSCLRQKPSDKLDVIVAFWGAEEKGLFGSRQFVRSFGSKLDKSRLTILNLDCLGVGDTFCVLTGLGIIFRRRADPNLAKLLKEACDETGEQWRYYWETLITGGSSDHAEWIENGFKAISVIRENQTPTTLPARIVAKLLQIPHQTQIEVEHAHTTSDTLEIIEKEKLENAVHIVQNMLKRINQQS